MTTPNDPQQPHPDALNALENFASGNGSPPQDPSVDASGFVGMMARGQVNEADPAGSGTPPPAMKRPMPNVSPKASVAPTPKGANPTNAAIPVAKEIIPEQTSPPEPQEQAEPAGEFYDEQPEAVAAPAATPANAPRAQARSRRRVPSWFATAVPISLTLGGLLMVIGLWALMAVLSWASGKDMVPGYTHEDSVLMPFVLLLSLPVGIVLEIMAVIMMKQVKRQAQLDEAEGI